MPLAKGGSPRPSYLKSIRRDSLRLFASALAMVAQRIVTAWPLALRLVSGSFATIAG